MQPQPTLHILPPPDAGAQYPASAEMLWSVCVQWAHQPRDGIRIPMDVAAHIARSVMEEAMRELIPGAAQIEVSAFCQRRARQMAVERVVTERERQNDRHLWHDAEWHPDEPLLDLARLQKDDNRAWQGAVPVLRQLAMPVIRGSGVPDEDADDVFAETLAAIVAPDARDSRPLDELLVAEQLPALCKVIARCRAADFQRRRTTRKRDISLEVANESDDHGTLPSDAVAIWPEMDLQDILQQSSAAVSPAQWEVITRLIIHPSDTHTSLIADARLMAALGIQPQSSEATRRRHLHEVLDQALRQIRRHLDQP